MVSSALALSLLAIEVFLLAVVTFLFVVLRVTWGAPDRTAIAVADPVWSLLCGAALVAGSVMLWFAQSASRRDVSAVTSLVGLACMYAIVALSLRIVDLGDRDPADIIRAADIPGMPTTVARRSTKKSKAAAAGDVVRGEPLYLATCAACHGPGGQGIAGTAPAYSDTGFVRSTDELGLARMIQQGRPITAPDNRSKRAMPAQGGNPFLTPQNVRDIAAYIKTLNPSAEATSAEAAPGMAAATLPNWVVPSAAVGAIGLERDASARWSPTQLQLADQTGDPRTFARRSQYVAGLFQLWNVVNLVHLAGAAMGVLFLFGRAVQHSPRPLRGPSISAVAVWWNFGTLTWLVFIGFFLAMG